MGRGVVVCCMSVVVIVVRGDEWKTTLNIAMCHPHESAAWAACKVGGLWQVNKKEKSSNRAKRELLGGVLRSWVFSLVLLDILITTLPPLPWSHITHCCVGTDALSQ